MIPRENIHAYYFRDGDFLPVNLFRHETLSKGYSVYEVILVNIKGYITEGSKCNVFFIRGNTLVTAPENQVLAGITWKYILPLARQHHISITEKNIKKKRTW